MLYLIIERFRGGNAAAVYARFESRGRLAPDGLRYMDSWTTADLTTCYQVMETGDRELLNDWMSNWADIVDFEVHEVITSADARVRVREKEPII